MVENSDTSHENEISKYIICFTREALIWGGDGRKVNENYKE